MVGLFLLVSVVCVVIAWNLWENRNDTDGKKALEVAKSTQTTVGEMNGQITSILNRLDGQDDWQKRTDITASEEQQRLNKINEELNINQSRLNDFNKKLAEAKAHPPAPKPIEIAPLTINVVYRQAIKKPLIPTAPPPTAEKSTPNKVYDTRGTLLKQAGVSQ